MLTSGYLDRQDSKVLNTVIIVLAPDWADGVLGPRDGNVCFLILAVNNWTQASTERFVSSYSCFFVLLKYILILFTEKKSMTSLLQ